MYKKVITSFIILFFCFILTGCGKADIFAGNTEANNTVGSSPARPVPDNPYQLINCANTYQSESGVNSQVYGFSIDDYLRQQMIKYNINKTEVGLTDLESNSFIKVAFLIWEIYKALFK